MTSNCQFRLMLSEVAVISQERWKPGTLSQYRLGASMCLIDDPLSRYTYGKPVSGTLCLDFRSSHRAQFYSVLSPSVLRFCQRVCL